MYHLDVFDKTLVFNIFHIGKIRFPSTRFKLNGLIYRSFDVRSNYFKTNTSSALLRGD